MFLSVALEETDENERWRGRQYRDIVSNNKLLYVNGLQIFYFLTMELLKVRTICHFQQKILIFRYCRDKKNLYNIYYFIYLLVQFIVLNIILRVELRILILSKNKLYKTNVTFKMNQNYLLIRRN